MNYRWPHLRVFFSLTLLVIFFPISTNPIAAEDTSSDSLSAVKSILDGVDTLPVSGVPGPICLFGERTFPVVTAPIGKGTVAPLIGATEFGRGRAVVFGHEGYLSSGKVFDHRRYPDFFRRLIFWSAGKKVESSESVTVGVIRNRPLEGRLREMGFHVRSLDVLPEMESEEFDVLIGRSIELGKNEESRKRIRKWVQQGGGLITGDLGWGWKQLHPGQSLREDHPGNGLLAPMGMAIADGYLRPGGEDGFLTSPSPSLLTVAPRALAALQETPEERSGEEIRQAVATLELAITSIPPTEMELLSSLQKLRTRKAEAIVPTAENPITSKTPLKRLFVTMSLEELQSAPPEKVTALPAASDFPGAVPTSAKRVTRKVVVDPKIHGWHSTGLYAAAGEVITIQVPESVVDLPKHRHPRIRIGVHRDTLWHLDRWKRWPEITLEKRIEGTETRLASPFGGLVYVTVPQPRQEGPFTVEIEGAVPAPYFVLGETDLETWREELRHAPAPWAELESDRVILTVPSEVVRDLDDPKEVMLFWNRVLDACAELIGRPMERNRPERYVADRQISAGYMHSGYPIMTWLDVRKKYVDLESLRQGNWGFFHEMGHNHQHPAWTFEGTVEVTCNLFTLYIYDQVLGIPPRRARDVLEDPKRSSKIEKYLQDGAEFSQWQRDPFLALIMYVQLQEAFGWEAYRNVFAEYRDTPPGELPRGEQEKRDQWMVRFSREVGRNLGPFFDRWGVPVTDEAKASIEDLPVWMPDEMR